MASRIKLFKSTIWIYLLLYIGCGRSTKDQEGPSPAKSPEQELASFQMEEGFKIQLVASEPMVQDPVFITFDEDGRLWVVEMRGFMPDIDGKGEQEPVGRISVLEDQNGDGQMDHSWIYLDSLIMPRAMALVKGGVLIAENKALWLAQDLDGNLKSDTKWLIDSTYSKSGLPEHTDNGLWRGMDNWYYSAKSHLRYKWMNNKWLRDSTEFRGQWGLSHDDVGRLFYNYNWSQLHADLVPPNYLSRNKNHTPTSGIDHGLTIDRRIYPIRDNPAVNRGYIPGTLDSAGRLLEFTAACAPLVLRSRLFPPAYSGNVFVCEPSGNLIKRNVVEESGFILTAHDPHPGTEFLASTDERFRPVNLCAGPDGGLYVADMYRGLIQHGAYVTPYLREQTLTRKLIAPIHRGRIWRIVPNQWKAGKPQLLSNAPIEVLVSYLSHSDGWYRDMAQRLLVERGDKLAIQPLIKLVIQSGHILGRNHALWTLDGLGWRDADMLVRLLEDSSFLISNTALRLLEPIVRSDLKIKKKLTPVVLQLAPKVPIQQALQIALSAYMLDQKAAFPLLSIFVEKFGTSPLMRDAILSSIQNKEFEFLEYLSHQVYWDKGGADQEIFLEMLTTCIVRKGSVDEMKSLLAKLDIPSDKYHWQQQVMLTALAVQGRNTKYKRITLHATPPLFVRKDLDEKTMNQIQSMSRLFDWPGHTETANNVTEASLNEDQLQLFVKGRQQYLTTCAGCHGTDGGGINRFAPSLIGSSWVLEDERRLALIILHGMEGPLELEGKIYDAPDILPVMPAHSTMDDASITAVLTYIRNEWGNQGGPITRGLVGKTRHTTQGRVMPWTAKELDKFILETKTTDTIQ